jgi:hypothetical protein
VIHYPLFDQGKIQVPREYLTTSLSANHVQNTSRSSVSKERRITRSPVRKAFIMYTPQLNFISEEYDNTRVSNKTSFYPFKLLFIAEHEEHAGEGVPILLCQTASWGACNRRSRGRPGDGYHSRLDDVAHGLRNEL